MGLKQLNNVQRIVFLNEFVSQIVINSAEDEILRKRIEEEKLKRKLLGREETPKIINFFEPVKEANFQRSMMMPNRPQRNRLPRKMERRPVIASRPRQPIGQQKQMPVPFDNQPVQVEGVSKKLVPLIKDNNVQMIECPGPGKNVVVKARNKIQTTNVILSGDEVKSTIESFSKSAKIPVIGGILKAAVGSLLISAVVSDYAGSRFIINKQSPYSLIEGF